MVLDSSVGAFPAHLYTQGLQASTGESKPSWTFHPLVQAVDWKQVTSVVVTWLLRTHVQTPHTLWHAMYINSVIITNRSHVVANLEVLIFSAYRKSFFYRGFPLCFEGSHASLGSWILKEIILLYRFPSWAFFLIWVLVLREVIRLQSLLNMHVVWCSVICRSGCQL